MANNQFAYIEKTMPKVVDAVFTQDSLTEMLMGHNYIKLDFLDAKTVRITKAATTGLTNYVRGGHGEENKKGAAQSSQEKFTLSQERWSAIPIDKLDTMDDGETIIGGMAGRFIKEHVVPEFDAYRFSKLASYTNVFLGNRVDETINANEIIKKFNAAFKFLKNNKVPTSNQVIYVSTSVMELIRNTEELVKHLTQAEYKDVSFTIERYEGRPIIEVPDDEFYTDLITDDNGFHPSATSKAINFMIVDKGAPIIVKNLDWNKVYSSEETNLGFVGYEFDNLYYHDLFVPDNKVVGIYCSVASTAAETAKVLPAVVKGDGEGNSKITNVLTQPAGIIWDELTNITDGGSHKIGEAKTGEAVKLNTDFKPNASNNVIAAIYDNKIVALSENFTTKMPKK